MKKLKISTPFGWYRITEENGKIIEISHTMPKPVEEEDSPMLRKAKKQLLEYFAGKRKEFTFPVEFIGTPFQKKVWTEMINIPYGEVCSYGELAKRVGHPKAARAVGTCCNRNPIGIVVPCHRVVASNLRIGGFAYGVETKIGLLELEGYKI